MKHVCIVGLGLIGGSLGMSLRRVRRGGKRVYHVTGLGRSASDLRAAKRKGAVDAFSIKASHAVPTADIIVLCVPVQFIAPVAKKILPFIKRGAVVTDVGSVKERVDEEMKRVLRRRRDIQFVGAHPLAGSEKGGIENAEANLFNKATVVVTGARASFSALSQVKALWTDVKARCLYLTSKDHDRLLAVTSHLPHLLAFSLVQLASDIARNKSVLKSLFAGSFRDMTRIAASDSTVWSGIVQKNRSELKKTAKDFVSQMSRILSLSDSKLGSTFNAISRLKKSW